jgi:hypothetical protein
MELKVKVGDAEALDEIMTTSQRLKLMRSQLQLLAHDCELLAVAGVDVQKDAIAMRILKAEELEAHASLLQEEARAIRRRMKAEIMIELLDLEEGGMVSLRARKDGRFDCAYRPMPLQEAISLISGLARELREPEPLECSDTHSPQTQDQAESAPST